ncbi:hypothetical protein [Agromyces aerolatus]|uniref:hypothetical protein n=1 Tax=Agromyces sp. LY-1074 TaxID=3074080 RepID=UPI00285DB9CD|nr:MULTISPECIES: hypothetical protein [unclassified Agromyces]MDR5700918.1 hypothetical protein [Agromyces sp. LY-1074]MDR5707421.1 hypothetical protein [Agromyces sp. LY-1358]
MFPLILGLISLAYGATLVSAPGAVSRVNTAMRTRLMGWIDPTARKVQPNWVYVMVGCGAMLMGVVMVIAGIGILSGIFVSARS